VISRNPIKGEFPIKRLGEVVEFLDSRRRPVTESDRRAGPYPYYGANGIQGTIDEFIFDEPLVLLAEDGGHFGEPERGIAYRISGKTWVNNHAHVLRPTPDIDLAYLCRVLENYDVTPFVTGTTRGKLTKAGASEIIIPLPPLPQQRRIAEVLDLAEVVRTKRRAALAQLDSLTQSLFLDLFGDPATNPKRFPTPQLADAIDLRGGFAFKSGDYLPEGIPLVRIGEVNRGGVTRESACFLPATHEAALARFIVHPGDMLMSLTGTTGKDDYGNVILLDDTFSRYFLNQRVALIEPKPSVLDRHYLLHVFRNPKVKARLTSKSRGIRQANISNGDVLELELPIPPIELQREFARRVTAVEKLKTAHRASLVELDALFASLQHRAFRGEL
jgi:type I restriction enzyme, S subunit